jgi:hypothetical protein
MPSATFCFTCGQPVTEPPRLNRLPGGEPCPACRERALDAVPSVLPMPGAGRAGRIPVEPYGELASQDLPYDDDRPEPA